MTEKVLVSMCCGADLSNKFIVLPVCTGCDLECDTESVCADCRGKGVVSMDEDDGEGHTMRGVGARACHCQNLKERDE